MDTSWTHIFGKVFVYSLTEDFLAHFCTLSGMLDDQSVLFCSKLGPGFFG